MKKLKIAVLGDGGWGTTLAILLNKKDCDVTLWGAFPDYVSFLKKKRENIKFLPKIRIPKDINITDNIIKAIEPSELIVLAIPAQYMRGVLKKINRKFLKGKTLVSAAKGIENKTLMRMSEVIDDCMGNTALAVLSGPSISIEVANGVPTAVVAASSDGRIARSIQQIFNTNYFRIYTTTDVIGVEIGGALKNIIAIACGISDGLGFGSNTKAALLTRGLVELTRLGDAMGADPKTFIGLSGMGDMATTCTSHYSRNRWLGEEIGIGKKLKDVLKSTEMVIEGVTTVKSAYQLSKRYNVDMPITKEVFLVLHRGKNPKKAVIDLMMRKQKDEIDKVVWS